MGGNLPNMIMLMAIGPLVTMGTPRTNLGPPGTIVVLASMGIRVGGRNNYLRFQRGDQGPDREGGRAGGGVAPGQTPILPHKVTADLLEILVCVHLYL